jgi:hypothetical protein
VADRVVDREAADGVALVIERLRRRVESVGSGERVDADCVRRAGVVGRRMGDRRAAVADDERERPVGRGGIADPFGLVPPQLNEQRLPRAEREMLIVVAVLAAVVVSSFQLPVTEDAVLRSTSGLG